MKRWWFVLAMLLAGSVAACSPQTADLDETPSPAVTEDSAVETPDLAPLQLVGAVALGRGAVIHGLPEPGQCRAHSEYADIEPGVQVVIRDAAGAVVATTELGAGEPYGDTEDCVWEFAASIPPGGGFYSAEVLEWTSELVAESDLATTIVAILPAG